METVLITTGSACIIIAIVGGGLEAFNIKVPSIISSIKRQILLAIFGAGLLWFGIYKDTKGGNGDTKTDSAAAKEMTYFMDNDGDGFGNKLTKKLSKIQLEHYVTDDSTDDDDNDKDLHDLKTANLYYADKDNDSFGDAHNSKKANRKPAGYSSDNSDCDDRDGFTYPKQNGWFQSKSRSGSFDYNCDGHVTKENEQTYLRTQATDMTAKPPKRYIKYHEG